MCRRLTKCPRHGEDPTHARPVDVDDVAAHRLDASLLVRAVGLQNKTIYALCTRHLTLFYTSYNPEIKIVNE